MFKILIVCTANICRSPMAEGVLRAMLRHRGIAGRFEIESAGTHAHRTVEKPDPRALAVTERRGYHDLDRLRSRTIRSADFERFDYILGMDRGNLAKLEKICPAEYAHKLHLFLDFAENTTEREVPDPYYGNMEGFERVLDLCEIGASGLIDACLRAEPNPGAVPQTP